MHGIGEGVYVEAAANDPTYTKEIKRRNKVVDIINLYHALSNLPRSLTSACLSMQKYRAYVKSHIREYINYSMSRLSHVESRC